MEPGIHNIPEPQHGTSWGYGYLAGATAQRVAVDVDGDIADKTLPTVACRFGLLS